MEGGSVKVTGPVCSCPDAEQFGGPPNSDRSLHFERPPSVVAMSEGYTGPLDRPQSRMSTLERPKSRTSVVTFDRPPSRATMTFERPPSRGQTGVFDSRILNAMVLERPPCGMGARPDGNVNELRASQGMLHCPREYERVPQVHSVCCAEWENGLGARSEWDIDVDIRQHIQQCTCTCNHMGYGNYMDYQVKKTLS
ncbi:hypothetical protein RUM44_003000 [Polyplax serrata]|uniref:Uncharacterized protein n=1 Tax=Polyplax serrata TaxID=468196 RepID=A0ABR1AXA4_POLSC